MSSIRIQPRHGLISATRAHLQRGAALVEMAILLPALCLCFYGVVEIGQYLTMSERMTKTVNQLSAILYTLRPSDLQSGGSANTVIGEAIRQSQTLAKPYTSPTITVRYCQRRTGGGTGPMEQIYFGATTPRIEGCGDGPGCQDSLITQSGYGAYVQAYACQRFQPVLTPRFFKKKGGDSPIDRPGTNSAGKGGDILVTQVAFIPLTDTNQTALIKKAGGTTVPTVTTPIVVPPTTCGGAGQPPCNTPTCGSAGQPSCNPNSQTDCIASGGSWNGTSCAKSTCGGPGQMSCNIAEDNCKGTGGYWTGSACLPCGAPGAPACAPLQCNGAAGQTNPACAAEKPCPDGYVTGNGGAYCWINSPCGSGASTCACPNGGAFEQPGVCKLATNCKPGQVIDGTRGVCASNCNDAVGTCQYGRDPSNCSCNPPPPVVNCGYGQKPASGGTGCTPICDSQGGYFYQGNCIITCPDGYTQGGSVCMKDCPPDQVLGAGNQCVPK